MKNPRKRDVLTKIAEFAAHDGKTNIRLYREDGDALRYIRDPDIAAGEVVPARPGEETSSPAPQGKMAPRAPWSEGGGSASPRGMDPSKPVGTKPDTKHTKVASFMAKFAKKDKEESRGGRAAAAAGVGAGVGTAAGALHGRDALKGRHLFGPSLGRRLTMSQTAKAKFLLKKMGRGAAGGALATLLGRSMTGSDDKK